MHARCLGEEQERTRHLQTAQSDAFLEFSNYLEPAPLPHLPGNPCRLETVRQSVYFMRLFECR